LLLKEASEIVPLVKEEEGLLEEEYKVKAILNKRKRVQKIKYLVK
jgi:hypothetical protein